MTKTNNTETVEDFYSIKGEIKGYAQCGDDNFWNRIASILIIEIDKTKLSSEIRNEGEFGKKSNSSNIEITAGKEVPNKTSDFFPVLEKSEIFPNRRIQIKCYCNSKNIADLGNEDAPKQNEETGDWKEDQVQIKRDKNLNIKRDNDNGEILNKGNPRIRILYDGDLNELRKRLKIGDYLIFLFDGNNYYALGLKKSWFEGAGKNA